MEEHPPSMDKALPGFDPQHHTPHGETAAENGVWKKECTHQDRRKALLAGSEGRLK